MITDDTAVSCTEILRYVQSIQTVCTQARPIRNLKKIIEDEDTMRKYYKKNVLPMRL